VKVSASVPIREKADDLFMMYFKFSLRKKFNLIQICVIFKKPCG